MRTLVVGTLALAAAAAIDASATLATVPGSMEITCDVDRRTFRALAKNETQARFRLWDSETGGAQCGPDYVALMKDLKVFNSKTDRFDAQRSRRFDSIRAVLGSDATPVQLCSGLETWLDVAVGTTTLTCDFSADDDPKTPPPPPARRRLHSLPFAQEPKSLPACSSDMVQVGLTCVDKYKASIWSIPNPTTTNSALVAKVRNGTVTLTDLTAGGATQLGCNFPPFNHAAYPMNFPSDGNWTPLVGTDPPSPGVYAVSLPGVLPSTCLAWFGAEQACTLSGKRLLTNQEWQRAAASTPDPGTDNGTTDCNVSAAGGPVNSGSRANCKSVWGVFDMVGNVVEWVGDWTDASSTGCALWLNSDLSCVDGNGSVNLPGALQRGGTWMNGANAGVFGIVAAIPTGGGTTIGFRCGR